MNGACYATQALEKGRNRHKNEVTTDDVHKNKDSRVIRRGGKSLRSTNVV